jgi:branched-chain amino acid aminotransferase
MHARLLHNGKIQPSSERTLSPGQVGLMNGWGIFSTIRVHQGVLFAFDRHWARMQRDATLMRVPMPADKAAFHRDLLSLVEANRAFDGTLRVVVVRNRGGNYEGDGIDREFDVIAFTTGLTTWGEGVRLTVQPQGRHAGSPFAGTKVMSWMQNLTFLDMAKSRGFDEAVLLDEHSRVSECTSANIFICTGQGVFTPPLSAGCLPGITRELLLGEIKVEGHPVAERHFTVDDLYSAKSAFITSTTRELLPILEVDGRAIGRDDSARQVLQAAFSQYFDAYVSGALARGEAALQPA